MGYLGFVVVAAAGQVATVHDVDVASRAEECARPLVSRKRANHFGPVPTGDDNRMPRLAAEACPCQSTAGRQRALDNPCHDRRTDVRCIDHVQHRVVNANALGFSQPRANGCAESRVPVRRRDRDDVRRCGHNSSAEHDDHPSAAAVGKRRHRGGQPAVHEHLGLSIPRASTRGQQHPGDPARKCCLRHQKIMISRPRTLAAMRDVLDQLMAIWHAGGTAGVATVVRTIRSAPRPPGAAMVVAPDGTVAGSVSGGCVEAAVYELATEARDSGRPALQRYGISADDAFAVGLTCGGEIDIFAEPVSAQTFPQLQAIADDIAAHRPTAVATVIAHPDPSWLGRRLVIGPDAVDGSLGSARADAAVTDDARGLLGAGRSAMLTYGPDGQRQDAGMEVFVASHAPRPRMLIFGAIDFAAALSRQAALLGYRVTVCDARAVFATSDRFPAADEVVVERPDRYLTAQAESGGIDARTAICVLTHDPKFDVPALQVALRLGQVDYIGVMGSRRTHEDRMKRLRETGLTDAQLSRLASPIGLDLGARTPEETAVSITAEIIARRWGGGGRPLSEVGGRIHHD